jgi:hypothetical protein
VARDAGKELEFSLSPMMTLEKSRSFRIAGEPTVSIGLH